MNGHWNGASCDCYSGFENSENDQYTCVKSSSKTPHCINGHWNGASCDCYSGFENSQDDQYECVKSGLGKKLDFAIKSLGSGSFENFYFLFLVIKRNFIFYFQKKENSCRALCKVKQ